MNVAVNGETRELPDGTTLAELLRVLDVAQRGIAVAVNERVVISGRFDDYELGAGDEIEIIRAVAGG